MPAIPADDLIARCRRVYAECETYADEGEYNETTTHEQPVRGRRTHGRQLFRTRWKRPDHLYFEFKTAAIGPEEDWDRYVIWSSPSGTRCWWTVQPAVERLDSLDAALYGARGISRATSTTITDLLRVKPVTDTLPVAPAGFRGEEAEVNGSKCLAVQMVFKERFGEEKKTRVWIELERGLILRVDESLAHTREQVAAARREHLLELEESAHAHLDPELRAQMIESLREMPDTGGYRVEESTVFRPRLNVPLDDAEFEFQPPEDA